MRMVVFFAWYYLLGSVTLTSLHCVEQSSRPVTKFTEDFDFMAMNEKFKKDEVWGYLGRSNKNHSKEKESDGDVSEEDNFHDHDNELPNIDTKVIVLYRLSCLVVRIIGID